jgi:hypothetical protein
MVGILDGLNGFRTGITLNIDSATSLYSSIEAQRLAGWLVGVETTETIARVHLKNLVCYHSYIKIISQASKLLLVVLFTTTSPRSLPVQGC